MSERKDMNELPVDTAKELADKELQDVSGGLWGITIIDTCLGKYDYDKCCNNFGRCDNLIVVSEDVQFDLANGQRIHNYVFSCAKGCFSNVNETETRDIR